jgi:hypothetical protein
MGTYRSADSVASHELLNMLCSTAAQTKGSMTTGATPLSQNMWSAHTHLQPCQLKSFQLELSQQLAM